MFTFTTVFMVILGVLKGVLLESAAGRHFFFSTPFFFFFFFFFFPFFCCCSPSHSQYMPSDLPEYVSDTTREAGKAVGSEPSCCGVDERSAKRSVSTCSCE